MTGGGASPPDCGVGLGIEEIINSTQSESAAWKTFADVRKAFGGADQVGKYTVFNIAGNKYRLVAVIPYNTERVYVGNILAHKEYDLGKWKKS